MSQILIQQYLNELSDLRRVSGTERETVVREAFKSLLKGWGRSQDLIFVPEYLYQTSTRDRRYIDGALVYDVRVPFGYWEAKDAKDNLDEEIEFKFRRGYALEETFFTGGLKWKTLIVQRLAGFSTSTRKGSRRITPSAKILKPIGSQLIRRK